MEENDKGFGETVELLPRCSGSNLRWATHLLEGVALPVTVTVGLPALLPLTVGDTVPHGISGISSARVGHPSFFTVPYSTACAPGLGTLSRQ